MSTHSLASALLLCCTVGLVYISFTTAAPVGSHNIHAIEKRENNGNDESFGDVTKESFENKFEGDNSTVSDTVEDHVDNKKIEDEVPNEKDNDTEEYDDEDGDVFEKSEEHNNGQHNDTHTESSSENNGKVDVPEHDSIKQKTGEHIDDHDSTLEHLDDQNEHSETSLSEQENLNSNQESNAEKTEGNSGDKVESNETQEMDLQSEDKHHEDSGETMQKEAERESHSELVDADDLSTKKDFHSSDVVEENDNANEDHIEDDKTDMIDSEVIVDKIDNKGQGEPAHPEISPIDDDLNYSEGSGSQEHGDVNSKGSDEFKTEEHELHSENLDDENESLAQDNGDTSVHSYEVIEDNDDKDAIMSNENMEKSDDTQVDKSLDVNTENVTEENENDKSNDVAPQYQDSEKENVDGDDILDAAVNFHDSSHEHSSYNEDDLKYDYDNTQENEEENNDSINHDEGASSENDKTDENRDDEDNTSDEKIEGNVSSDHKTQSGEGGDESMNTLPSHHNIDDTEKENTEEHDELNEHDEVTSLEEVGEHNEHHESDENDSTTHEAGESFPIKTNDVLKTANGEDTRKSDGTYDEDGSVAVDDEIIPYEDEDKTSQDNEEKNASAIENHGDKSDLSLENEMDGSVDSVAIPHDIEENESINSNENEAVSEQDAKDEGTNENQGGDDKNGSDGDMDVIPVPHINEDNELEEDENENESVNEHNLRNNSQEEDELDELSNLSVPYDTDKTLQNTEEEHENKDNSSQEKENEHDITDDSVIAIDRSLLTSQQSEEANDKLEEHEDNKESELQVKEDESADSVNGEFSHNISEDNEDGEHSNSHHKEEENDDEVGNVHIPIGSEDNSSQEDEENRMSEHYDEDTVSSTSIPHGDEEEDDDDYDDDDDEESNVDGVGSLLIPHEEVNIMSQENEEKKYENRSVSHEDGALKENSKDDDDDDKEEENDDEVGNVHIPIGSEDNSSQEDEENRMSEHYDEDTVRSTSIPHGDEEEDDDDYDDDDEESNVDGVGSLLIPHEEVNIMSQENEEKKYENRSVSHEDGALKENSKDGDDDDEEEEEAFISSKHHEVSEEFVSHINVDSNDEQTVNVNKYENGDRNETSARRFNEDNDVLDQVSRRQELYEDNGKDQKVTLQDFFATLLAPSHSENGSESHSTIQTDNHKVTIKPLEPFAQDTNEETPKEKEEIFFWLVDSGNNEKEKDDDYLAVTKEPQESHDFEDGSGSGEPVTENPVERTDAKIFDTALQIPNEQDETTEKIQEPIVTSIEQSESGSGNSQSAGTRKEDLILQSSKKNIAEQSKVSGVNEVGVGQDSEDPNAETQQTSTGSYVVLGVIMAIIVALLGYSVLRSRRRNQATKPEEDFGTEMKDVEKSLLPSTGNGNVRTSRHPEGIDDEDDESKIKLLSPMNLEDGDSKPTKIVVNGDDMKFNDMVTIERQNEDANTPASESASTVNSASPNVHHEHVIEIGKSKSPTQMARERFFNMNPYQQSSTLNEDDRISESAIEKTSPHNGLVNGNSDGSAFVNGHVLDDLPSSKVKVVEKMDEDSVLKKPVFVNNGKNDIPC